MSTPKALRAWSLRLAIWAQRSVTAGLIGLSLGEATAQPPASHLRFSTTVESPTVGIRIPAPHGAVPVGLPPPAVQTYRNAEGLIMEMQSPRDYWISSQFLGRWTSPSGVRMTLARVGSMLPLRWPRPHVLPAEYDAVVRNVPAPQSEEDWRQWVELWTGAPLEEPGVRDLPPTARLAKVRVYRFKGNSPFRRGVAWTFRPGAFISKPDQWFIVFFETDTPQDGEAFERELIRSFLPNITTFMPITASPAPGGKPSNQPGADPSLEAQALELSRRRALDSIRGKKDWWSIETPYYVIVSDLKGSRAATVRQIADDLETLRGAFSKLVPPVVPIQAVSVVRIFGEGADYVQWVGDEQAWSGGMWIPQRGELVIRAREWGSPRERREWLVGTVYHEAFHQYLHYALGGRIPAAWYNEGHATFFEGAEIRSGQLAFAEEPRYASAVHQLVVEKRLNIPATLRLSYRDLYDTRAPGDRAADYARCWVIIYYLRKFAMADAKRPFHDFLPRYLEAFLRTGKNESALEEALGGRPASELEEAILTFWRSRSARREAERFDPLNQTR